MQRLASPRRQRIDLNRGRQQPAWRRRVLLSAQGVCAVAGHVQHRHITEITCPKLAARLALTSASVRAGGACSG